MTELQIPERATDPCISLIEEAMVGVMRTARVLEDAVELLLKQHGISAAQYNVLRILRGTGCDGLGRNEIRDRLLARMPDVTRLLDRMEEAGLVRRERDSSDRRCVPTFLTDQGRVLVDALDEPISELHRKHFGQFSEEELQQLVELASRVRRGD